MSALPQSADNPFKLKIVNIMTLNQPVMISLVQDKEGKHSSVSVEAIFLFEVNLLKYVALIQDRIVLLRENVKFETWIPVQEYALLDNGYTRAPQTVTLPTRTEISELIRDNRLLYSQLHQWLCDAGDSLAADKLKGYRESYLAGSIDHRAYCDRFDDATSKLLAKIGEAEKDSETATMEIDIARTEDIFSAFHYYSEGDTFTLKNSTDVNLLTFEVPVAAYNRAYQEYQADGAPDPLFE